MGRNTRERKIKASEAFGIEPRLIEPTTPAPAATIADAYDRTGWDPEWIINDDINNLGEQIEWVRLCIRGIEHNKFKYSLDKTKEEITTDSPENQIVQRKLWEFDLEIDEAQLRIKDLDVQVQSKLMDLATHRKIAYRMWVDDQLKMIKGGTAGAKAHGIILPKGR